MSNNLVSEQLTILNGSMGPLEPAYVNVDSSVLNTERGMMEPVSTDSTTLQFAISNQQMQLVDQISYIPGSQNLIVSDRHLGNMDLALETMGSQNLLPIDKDRKTIGGVNMGSQKLHPNKRKAEVGPSLSNSIQQQLAMPDKHAAHLGPLLSSPGPLHNSNKKAVRVQSMSSVSGSQNFPLPNKKMVRNESISSRSGNQRVQTPKGRMAQLEAPSKIQESSEAVRSKMRESLTSALVLVCENQNKNAKQEKSSPHKVDVTPSQMLESSKLADSTFFPIDASGVTENLDSKGTSAAHKHKDNQNSFAEASLDGMANYPQTWKGSGQESVFSGVLRDDDVSFADSFFVKDELLQGNGLSWAWDMDIEATEPKEVQNSKHVDIDEDGNDTKLRSHESSNFRNEANQVQAAKNLDNVVDGGVKNLPSPETLAVKIEVELFKLFGGVNKKYKEKGRSLIFNLKDRSNPELRERVMCGEISPERLCSMTAEELASKELSEWRTAKAEELAQMIVLPDTDGDRRRLVKKTHKGEYHVEEIGHDDSVSVEVSVGTTTFTQLLPKSKETVVRPLSDNEEIKNPKNVENEKGSVDNQDSSYNLTIPADGTDLMQGLIEDEFKDADFLPPIVSLDEFMESLSSEPPFDNLAVDAGQTKSSSRKVKSETDDKLVASNPVSRDTDDNMPGKSKTTNVEIKIPKFELDVDSIDNLVEQKHLSPNKISVADRVWEGELELQISFPVKVIGLFRSGEKTSTKDWSSSLEIKGRVRLDAFEKFLQQLPMSRSRAVMVIHFVLKPGLSDEERASLSEVIDSYVVDERLGFAEPAKSTELYLTPPHPKIVEMLSKHLAKEHTDIIRSTDNGLVGIVVWRRADINSTISPKSSHSKHGSKKQQHLMSTRREKKDTNVGVNIMRSKSPIPYGQSPSTPTPYNGATDDDDIPPGFGPGHAPDEDDLPEFNFSSNSALGRVPSQPSSRLATSHPDQLRQLIQKYGQAEHSENRQAWNTEDDDDIPEWRPDIPPLQPTAHGFHQPPMQRHIVNQPVGPFSPQHLMLLQQGAMPTPNMAQNFNPTWQQGGRWTQPPNVGRPPGNWRQDGPGSRGF